MKNETQRVQPSGRITERPLDNVLIKACTAQGSCAVTPECIAELATRWCDHQLIAEIRACLQDREKGAMVLRSRTPLDEQQLLTMFAVLGYCLGKLLPDLGSRGQPWRKILARHDSAAPSRSNSFHFNPCRSFPLHTDGAYHEVSPEWLGLAMIRDTSCEGGRSRLLHLDDWEDRDRFVRHPFARKTVTWLTPAPIEEEERPFFRDASLRLLPEKAPFSEGATGLELRYFLLERGSSRGSCVRAEAAQLEYLYRLGESLESSRHSVLLRLREGDILFANNRFLAHGREPFDPRVSFERVVWRMRGRFST